VGAEAAANGVARARKTLAEITPRAVDA